MLNLTKLVSRPCADIPIDRLWLVFFSTGEGEPWWCHLLSPGYRHVAACAWFAETERWVYFNPTRKGTVILLYREDEFGPRFTQLMQGSSLVLRVRSQLARTSTPFGWWCTGSIKALLGIRCRALAPRSLADHLLRHGAEMVELPGSARSNHGEPVQA